LRIGLWRDKALHFSPLIVALAALMAVLAWLLAKANVAGLGHNLYALDDAYIHMAMARNLAQHGVWGVTPYSFSGSSSSMLWTLLLAGLFRLFGPLAWLPLALNVVSAAGIAVLLNHIMPKAKTTGDVAIKAAALAGIALLIPLPSLVFFGMENTLHVLLALGLCYVAAREITAPSGKANFLLLALVTLSVMARFESLFIVSGIMILLAVRRQWSQALLAGVAAALPVVVYGLISRHQGWMWLPNSVLVKGNMPQVDLLHYGLSLARRLYGQIAAEKGLFALIALALVMLEVLRRPAGRSAMVWSSMLLLTLWTLLLHLMFAKLDSGRYEAYLMALLLTGTFGGMIEFSSLRSLRFPQVVWRHWSALLLVGLVLAPVAVRSGRLVANVAPSIATIYRQQVQMGAFVARYCEGATVVLNDIGAVNYLAPRLHCVDFAGLATMDSARWMLAGGYTTQKLQRLATEQNADLALVYDSWLRRLAGGIPPGWVKLEEWTTVDGVSPDHRTVAIYAVKTGIAAKLRRDLQSFRPSLPVNVLPKVAEAP
jgi:hypothetical protein